MNSNNKDNKEFWFTEWLNDAAFEDLRTLFNLKTRRSWPDFQWMTNTFQGMQGCQYVFTDSNLFNFSDKYYEEIIFHEKAIPTRKDNWHDLFNCVIWCLFGQTKQLLNQQHMDDIHAYGLNPRTKRRNRITHFDECGVVVAYSNEQIIHDLSAHKWIEGFYDQRACWGTEVKAYIFGHANYEMLLNPFIGLTGKWVGIGVEEDFFEQDLLVQYQQLDGMLAKKIINEDIFSQQSSLLPLPLLGVPHWAKDNCQRDFYLNTEYFRPKTKRASE